MALMPKLEKAVDHGSVLIEETIDLVRLTKDLVRATTPLVLELPALVTSAKTALDALPRPPR